MTTPRNSHAGRWLQPLLVCVALAWPGSAQALAGYQSAAFTFGTSNTLGAGNYGTVLVEAYTGLPGSSEHGLLAGQVRLTVETPFLASYGNPASASNYGMDKFAFNTDLSLLASQIVTTTTGGTNLNWGVQFSKNISNFGTFSILDKGAGNSRGNPIVVTISGLGSNATLGHFVRPSAGANGGEYFVAHVAGFPAQPTSHFVAVNDITTAPEPSGIVLALAGMTGLGVLGWRRRGQLQATEQPATVAVG